MTTTVTVELDTPIVRGEQTITRVELRKPDAGSLRGVSLINLLQMDVDALIAVVPRVSNPVITAPDVTRMDPADLLQIGSAISGFLLPKSAAAAQFPTA